MEFLLTGSIVRREMLASAQDEFADSLRNAHMPDTLPVFVQAEILGSDGKTHLLKRTLQSDYAKKATCTSIFEIDGKSADQSALARLGVVLSQPPIAAPILMQHTLGYLFSAKPQERSLYFKALLEVSDLDTLRSTIDEREATLQRAEPPTVTKLRSAAGVAELAPVLATLLEFEVAAPNVSQVLALAAETLLKAAAQPLPVAQPERLKAILDLLTAKRSKAFPLTQFDRKPMPAGQGAKEELWESLSAFVAQSSVPTENSIQRDSHPM